MSELVPSDAEEVTGEVVLPRSTGIEWEEWDDPRFFATIFKVRISAIWMQQANDPERDALISAIEYIKSLAR